MLLVFFFSSVGKKKVILTYIIIAMEDLTRLLFEHSCNISNPSFLSGFHPRTDTALRILAGNADKTKCTAPILNDCHQFFY